MAVLKLGRERGWKGVKVGWVLGCAAEGRGGVEGERGSEHRHGAVGVGFWFGG